MNFSQFEQLKKNRLLNKSYLTDSYIGFALKNIVSGPLFTIIFRPKFLFLDSVSILRLKTMVVLHILKHSKIVSDMAFFMIVCIRGTSNLHRYIYVVCISWMSTKTLSNHSNLTAMFEFHDFFSFSNPWAKRMSLGALLTSFAYYGCPAVKNWQLNPMQSTVHCWKRSLRKF